MGGVVSQCPLKVFVRKGVKAEIGLVWWLVVLFDPMYIFRMYEANTAYTYLIIYI